MELQLKEFELKDMEKENNKKRLTGWLVGIILGIILLYIFPLAVYLGQKILFIIGTVLFIIELIILFFVEYCYSINKKNIWIKLFYDEFEKEYKKLEIADEIIEDIQSDFEKIIEYNSMTIENNKIYPGTEPLINLSKYKIKENDIYIGDYDKTYYLYRGSVTISYIFVAIKLAIPKRLCMEITEAGKVTDTESYILTFDSQEFDRLSLNLSECFYHKNFKEIISVEYWNDEELKNKLQNIAKKYKIQYVVTLKNNLLCLQVVGAENIKKQKERVHIEYNAIIEILNVFFEYEKIHKK